MKPAPARSTRRGASQKNPAAFELALPDAAPAPRREIKAPNGADNELPGLRIGAWLIDLLIALPLQTAALFPAVGLLMAPVLCLYWLSRYSFFGGQSVGKKVMKLQVVRMDGAPFTWTQSAQRNILALLFLIEMLPLIGFVGVPLSLLAAAADFVCVLATQRRIGDRFASTLVVRQTT